MGVGTDRTVECHQRTIKEPRGRDDHLVGRVSMEGTRQPGGCHSHIRCEWE